uniref:Variant-specific surface protein n=1 Tax=Macrostomum lignano TaxID=282301 RepID=A0A1I8F445_9PLAT
AGGHAITCLTYQYSGITGGTPTATECGSAVTTCYKYQTTTTTPASSSMFKNSLTLTSYRGSCGGCNSAWTDCNTCNTDQCNSAFAAVRSVAPLSLALPLVIAATLAASKRSKQ